MAEENKDHVFLTHDEMSLNCFATRKFSDGKEIQDSACPLCLKHIAHTWKEHNLFVKHAEDLWNKKVAEKEKKKALRSGIKKKEGTGGKQ